MAISVDEDIVNETIKRLIASADRLEATNVDDAQASTESDDVWTGTPPPSGYRSNLSDFNDLALQARSGTLRKIWAMADRLRNYADTMKYVVDAEAREGMERIQEQVLALDTPPVTVPGPNYGDGTDPAAPGSDGVPTPSYGAGK